MRLFALAAATLVLGGMTALTLPASASAASFDCRRAATATERTICANLGLNDRDRPHGPAL